MGYEYKCVAAPEKARRRRGAKTRTARVAGAMEDILKAEAVDGWEYQRTDLIPVEEKSGMFSRAQEVHRAVMVFRRALETSAPAAAHVPMAAPAVQVVPEPPRTVPEPVRMQHAPQPQPQPADTEDDFRLAADRNAETVPQSSSTLRAPKGLG